eukprot:5938931-Amphidinium_carterae.1
MGEYHTFRAVRGRAGSFPDPGLGVPARHDVPEGEQVRPADAGALLGETPIVPAKPSLPMAPPALEELPDLPDLDSEEQKEPTPLDTLSVFHDALEHPNGLDSRPVAPTDTREPRDIKSDGDVSSSEESDAAPGTVPEPSDPVNAPSAEPAADEPMGEDALGADFSVPNEGA